MSKRIRKSPGLFVWPQVTPESLESIRQQRHPPETLFQLAQAAILNELGNQFEDIRFIVARWTRGGSEAELARAHSEIA